MEFLSTPSARRATWLWRAGKPKICYFYPRPPRGGRRFRLYGRPGLRRFLSTPSARRATSKMPYTLVFTAISIHALREEGDRLRVMSSRGTWLFLSTPSARRATICHRKCSPLLLYFYPRPPRGGRRIRHDHAYQQGLISIHALREEGDSKNRDKISIFKQIVQHSARI